MIIYIVVFVLMGVCSFGFRRFLKNASEKKRNFLIATFCFALLYLLLALKNISVGSDSPDYFNHYNQLNSESWSSVLSLQKEFACYGIMKIFSSLGANYYIFQIFYYLILIIPLVIFSAEFCPFPEVFAMAFLGLDEFSLYASALRQAGAISIFLMAVFFFFKTKGWKKFVLFYLFDLLAFFFHHSAIVTFIFPLLWAIPVPKIKNMFFFVIPFWLIWLWLVPYSYSQFYEKINPYYPPFENHGIPLYATLLMGTAVFSICFVPGTTLFKKVDDFIDRKPFSLPYLASGNSSIISLEKTNGNIVRYQKSANIVCISSFLMGLSVITPVAGRIVYFFSPFLFLIISLFPSFFSNKKAKCLILIVLFVFLFLSMAWTLLYHDALGEVPYVFL